MTLRLHLQPGAGGIDDARLGDIGQTLGGNLVLAGSVVALAGVG